MREINHNMFQWKDIDVLIKRLTHVRDIELVGGFWNICGCEDHP